MSQPTMPLITRQELAGHLRQTFDTLGLLERRDVLTTLERGGVSSEVVASIASGIPEGVRMPNLRALWHYLDALPVDRERQ